MVSLKREEPENKIHQIQKAVALFSDLKEVLSDCFFGFYEFMNTIEELKTILLEILESKQKASDKKFSEAFQIWLSWAEFNLSKKSVDISKIVFKHFLKFRGDLLINQINSLVVDEFIIYLMKRAPKGFSVYFRTVRSMFSKFVAWNFIPENPFAKIKLKRVQRNEQKYLDEKTFYQLIELESNKVLKALFEFDFLTGLRLSEIANLTWQDVNLKENFIQIGSENFTTKSRRIRKVPLCDRAIEILESLKPKVFSIDKPNFIFCKVNGFKYSNDFISKSFKRLVRKAGLDPQIHFHVLRHSFTTNLISKGAPIFHVSQLLGHSNIATTQIYSHSNLDDLKKVILLIDKTNSQTNQTEVNEQ